MEKSERDGNTRPPYLPFEKLVIPEATVRTGHGTMNWFKIGTGVYHGCILSPYVFSLYAEYLIQNSGLDEPQTGIKIVRTNINNLRYVDDTTLMAKVKRN